MISNMFGVGDGEVLGVFNDAKSGRAMYLIMYLFMAPAILSKPRMRCLLVEKK